MGLTRIRTWTFWWGQPIGDVGRYDGLHLRRFADSRPANLGRPRGKGSFPSGNQLKQITSALVLLGVFPFVVRMIMKKFTPIQPQNSTAPE